MRIRAILLIAIFIAGTYVMVQTMNDGKVKEFNELLKSRTDPFISLLFTKPSTAGESAESWVINEETEIETLLLFLQNYQVRKLKPEEVELGVDLHTFSISLQDSEGNTITILPNDNLIIENSSLYYEVVNGPLDVDWLVHFFVQNRDH